MDRDPRVDPLPGDKLQPIGCNFTYKVIAVYAEPGFEPILMVDYVVHPMRGIFRMPLDKWRHNMIDAAWVVA